MRHVPQYPRFDSEHGRRTAGHRIPKQTAQPCSAKDLIAKAGLTVREAIREKGAPYAELGLDNPALSDDELLDAMLALVKWQRVFIRSGSLVPLLAQCI